MRPILHGKNNSYKLWMIYGFICAICIIGIGMAVYKQFFEDEKKGAIIDITDSEYEDKYNELINNFSMLFTNNIYNLQANDIQVKKIKEKFDFVATRQIFKEKQENYTLDVHIPIININNQDIKNYNQKIYNTYTQKVKDIKNSNWDIYNVRYKCYIQENILSLVIYSELIEKNNNQKVMIETFNYNLTENKEIGLEELLTYKSIKIPEANNKIKNEIKEIHDKNNSLIELGYNLYKRDLSSNMYEVSNIEQFFLGEDGNIYVVFAYGNYDLTNEMDVVIFMNK